MKEQLSKACIILTFLFLSCGGNRTNTQATKKKSMDTLTTEKITESKSDEKKKPLSPTTFFIKNESKYSPDFLKEFKERHNGYNTVSLIDDTIIINNDRKSLVIIPTDLPINTAVKYRSKDHDVNHILTVKRTNYSTIEYNYYEIINGNKGNSKQGLANLEPVFYFGAEGTFEDEEGNIFGMNEYIDGSDKDCMTYIYIGVRSIEKSFLIQRCGADKDILKTPELTRVR